MSLRPAITGHFDANNHQGLFGEFFIAALAAAAGLNLGTTVIDVGTDWSIASPGPRGTMRNPKIYAQVKSWSDPVGDAEAWNYRLKVPAFNHLAGPNDERHFLFLVLVPKDASKYADGSERCLTLNHAAYWVSLAEREQDFSLPTSSSVPVRVPKKNLLTVETLTGLVEGHIGVGS